MLRGSRSSCLLLHWSWSAAAAPAATCSAAAAPAAAAAPLLLQQHQHLATSRPACNVDGRIGADADEVAELIEANIVRPPKRSRGDAPPHPARLLTTRREALSLYREVLRYSNLFVWRDEHGRVWRDVIRASARSEFEAARREPDPELINRMIVTARDAVQRTVDGFLARRQRIIQEEDAAAGGPHGGPPPPWRP